MNSTDEKSVFSPAILFIQQQHADILEGLHVEMEVLKRRCSGLQFQLELKSPLNPAERSVEEHGENVEVCQRQKEENQDFQWKYTQLKKELKSKNASIRSMKKELEDKAATIAFLSTELHKVTLGLSVNELEHLNTPFQQTQRKKSIDDETTSLPDTCTHEKESPSKLRRIRSSYHAATKRSKLRPLSKTTSSVEGQLPENYRSPVASLPPIKSVVRHQLRVQPVIDMETLAIDNPISPRAPETVIQKESWSF